MNTYCIFQNHGQLYAICATEIRIVLSSPQVIATPIPNPHILGMMNIYGDLYTAVRITHSKKSIPHKYCIVLTKIHIGILCENVELVEIENPHNNRGEIDSFPPYVEGLIHIDPLLRIHLHFQNDKENPTEETGNICLLNISELQKYIQRQSKKRYH